MMCRLAIGFILAALVVAAPASAEECRWSGDLDAIEAAIRAVRSCEAASAIATACAFGASGDVSLASAVSDVCEKDFLAVLDRPERSSYAQQRAACLAKYRNKDGTMYRSAEAFCQSGVSERFSRRALRAKATP